MTSPIIFAAWSAIASAIALAGVQPAAAQEQTVRVGVVKSVATAANMIPVEKGYFKDLGIKAVVEDLDASTDALALLAQGQFQIVEGGIAASYFNALAKKFPVVIAADRVSAPNNHRLIVRTDVAAQIPDIKALSGRTIAVNSSTGIAAFELGKILKSAGLTLKDVELKSLPFPQMAVALANKAVDAALPIVPFAPQIIERKLGVVLADPDDFVVPGPLVIAVAFVNTDWAAKYPKVARDYFTAYMRGVREYCHAYHDGPNRREVIDVMVRTKVETRPEFLQTLPWPARNPLGLVNTAAILDMQDWYAGQGLVQTRFPAGRLVDTTWIDDANARLGPFEAPNPESKLGGCR